MMPVRLRSLNMNSLPDAEQDIFRVLDVEGLDSASVEYTAEGQYGDGSVATRSVYGNRELLIKGIAHTRSSTEHALWRLRQKLENAVAGLARTPEWVYFDTPTPGVPFQCMVRAHDRLHFATPSGNTQHFEIALIAEDPRKYSQVERTYIINGGPLAVVNLGNEMSYAIATLNGQSTGAWIQNDSLGQRVTLLGTQPAGSKVDFLHRYTYRPDQGITEIATRPRVWWGIRPGTNAISSNGSFTLVYRDAFL